MRDAKLLFHHEAAVGAASKTVDANSSRPGIGSKPMISVTVNRGGTAPLTLTVKSSDKDDMSGAQTDAVITVPLEAIQMGGAVYSDYLPEWCKRYLTLDTAGGAGITAVTAGIDYGLRSGKPANKPYNV